MSRLMPDIKRIILILREDKLIQISCNQKLCPGGILVYGKRLKFR
jgi:hypothetical protein